jgi:hypothetical protein
MKSFYKAFAITCIIVRPKSNQMSFFRIFVQNGTLRMVFLVGSLILFLDLFLNIVLFL